MYQQKCNLVFAFTYRKSSIIHCIRLTFLLVMSADSYMFLYLEPVKQGQAQSKIKTRVQTIVGHSHTLM